MKRSIPDRLTFCAGSCLTIQILQMRSINAVYGGNVVNDGYSEVPVTNTVPVAYPIWPKLGTVRPASAIFTPDMPPLTFVMISATKLAATLKSTQKARKPVFPTLPTVIASASSLILARPSRCAQLLSLVRSG